MFRLKLLLITYLISNNYRNPIMVIKGYPFSVRSTVEIAEKSINAIEKNNISKGIYLYQINNKQSIIKLKNYLDQIVEHRAFIEKGYDLRMLVRFDIDKDITSYYFDLRQNLVKKGRVYKLDEDDKKIIFSYLCIPKIKDLNENYLEKTYWKYAKVDCE